MINTQLYCFKCSYLNHGDYMVSSNYFYLITVKCLHSYMVSSLPIGGACGIMVIVTGNGHGNASSNPGRD